MRLKRPIYGLRQSGRYWYIKFGSTLKAILGMQRCEVDHSVFYRHQGNKLIIIITSVDDLTTLTSTSELMHLIKMKLRECFEITDTGEIHWILGIAAHRDRAVRMISLLQTAYINSVVWHYGLESAKDSAIPMDAHNCLLVSQSPWNTEKEAAMCDYPVPRDRWEVDVRVHQYSS